MPRRIDKQAIKSTFKPNHLYKTHQKKHKKKLIFIKIQIKANHKKYIESSESETQKYAIPNCQVEIKKDYFRFIKFFQTKGNETNIDKMINAIISYLCIR